MISSSFRLAVLGIATLCSAAAFARVEVEAVQHKSGPMLVAKVSEDIAPGDYDALMKGVLGHPGKFARKIVILDSIGGSVPEAIRMGRLLRETGFDALVPSTGLCQGTCVYLLAAGRGKMVRGSVGLHRPYYAHGDSSRDQALYKGVRYNSAAYFKEMNIPPSLLEDMQRIDPRQMRVLSASDLARYRLAAGK
ncbi:hypothetical protein PSm6_45760 [Pseudomonas solani]|uniref:Periplasmic protein-like protein n=1 Tax=Pseudomonas solani TaxID=2731552 RepID=A0AAU7XZ12_9PSED|nr:MULTISPECIES: periplasmic-like protein [Pseudomonas]MBB4819659.1 hypothetical protein [Pseudomonas alcaligenes]MDU9416344.1 hypothetical protein [Pseudomonas sp. zfem005]BCD88169.1 hypothetical protein PSm6_45760 [Pseudomonas solani]